MKKLTYEQKIVLLLCLFIFTFILGIYIGKAITPTYIIHINTSDEEILDWFVKYHGLTEDGIDYNYQGGHSFVRDGETISLFTNPARSAYAEHITKK